jgi:hypothetical protein
MQNLCRPESSLRGANHGPVFERVVGEIYP